MSDLSHLITDEYRALNRHLHEQPRKFGQSGRKHAGEVIAVSAALGVDELLDYGCGQHTLREALTQQNWRGLVHEYDPAVAGFDVLPAPAPLLVCTDVLEHVEHDKLDAVLNHIYALTKQVAFLAISTVPSNKSLRDGRNAHLIVESPKWWRVKLGQHGFRIQSQFVRHGDEGPADVRLWVGK